MGMSFDNKPSVSLAEFLEKRREIEHDEFRVFVDMLMDGGDGIPKNRVT